MKVLKVLGLITTIGGAVFTIANELVNEKKTEKTIEKKVEKKFNEMMKNN